jgi:hypothetical protein
MAESINIKHTIMFSNPTFNETCLSRTLYIRQCCINQTHGYVVETHNEYELCLLINYHNDG